MPRSQGFARGDLDTSFPLDDKFVALRGSTDAATYYAAAGVYFHVVAATWRESERKSASRIAPDAPELVALLVRIGLLDNEECVPRRAYTHSIGRALRARRTATDRKQRNRAAASRPVPRDSRARHGMSTDIQSGAERSRTEPSPTDQNRAERNGASAEPYDDTVKWLAARQAWVDSPKIETDLARMVDKKGAAAVIAAMDSVPGAETAAQFVYGARNALFPLAGSSVSRPTETTPDPDRVEAALAKRRADREAARHA